MCKYLEPFYGKGCIDSALVQILWAMPLPRAELPSAKDEARRKAAFDEYFLK
jgi:hypothetical protein